MIKLLICFLFAIQFSINSFAHNLSKSATNLLSDTSINPYAKVIMSNGEESLEFSPMDSVTKGALIEPVNRNTNRGISTSFYLSDSSFWSFYTNATERLTINGNGNITTQSHLLVNNAIPDEYSVLRVNGNARFDTSLIISATSDTNSFISIERNLKSIYTDADDSISPYTGVPTEWAKGKNIPVFRLRHPNDVSNNGHNTSIARDFKILPYQYGTAIEYNGVVECWVGEWSIHKGLFYSDVEKRGNGWGGILWVGDDVDGGGVRTTARNNIILGGQVAYGEVSVEKFTGEANGDLRLRLPSTENSFQFVYGSRGSNDIIAKISSSGLIIPMVKSVDSLTTPEKAQIAFDTSDNRLKAYNGTKWIALSENNMLTGKNTTSSNGVDTVYKIQHNLNTIPPYFNVIASSRDAAQINYVTADDMFIYINYSTPPPSGTDNLSWNWLIKN